MTTICAADFYALWCDECNAHPSLCKRTKPIKLVLTSSNKPNRNDTAARRFLPVTISNRLHGATINSEGDAI